MTTINPPSNKLRDVRVTKRDSIISPFIAPDLSPVQPHLAIGDAGTPGWTDFALEVPSVAVTDHRPAGFEERRLEEMRVGAYVPRKAQPKARVMNHTGPNARHKAMQARANALAGR